MPALGNLRSLLYLPTWEGAPPIPTGGSAFNTGCVVAQADIETDPFQTAFFQQAGGFSFMFFPEDNAWVQVPRSGLTAIVAGNAMCWTPNGPTGTVSAATTTSVTTAYSSVRNLGRYTLRLLSGKGAGQERVVAYNTVGANTVFTVTQPWDTVPDATTTWVLRSGRFLIFCGGTVTGGLGGSQRIYDVASLAPLSLNISVTNLPGTWGTSGALVSPNNRQFCRGTATSGGASTLTDTGKNWSLSWANFQVRILSGTGAGQIRTIASSTATQLTVSAAWSTPPSIDSVYVIESNEDLMYLIGNGASTIYRYSWSANTWTALTPTVARATVPAAGATLHCIDQENHPLWTDENACLNGRYLYSFSGTNNTWDRFDITSLAWSVAPGSTLVSDTVSTSEGSCVYAHGHLYYTMGGIGFRRFSPSRARIDGWGLWPNSLQFIVSSRAFNRMFASKYVAPDGATVRRVFCGVSAGSAIWAKQELDL